jgi:chaperonin GroES
MASKYFDFVGACGYISSRPVGVLITIPPWPNRIIYLNGGSLKMAVNLTPLHDRVIVKRIEEKESVKGGIIIPDSAKEKQQEGEVIAVGPGKREKDGLHPLDVKVGDRVLFGKYGGTEIKIEEQELLILREEEILAKLGGQAKAAKR